MLKPNEVFENATLKEDENYKFRTYLKIHANPGELDKQFKRLHQELFSEYDCSQCRNCCKKFKGEIPKEDIAKDAAVFGLTDQAFIDEYLNYEETDDRYQTKNCPCDFFDEEDGSCKLGDCKPENCKRYPYTDQPDRLSSMLSILGSAKVCPVVYEILERLKVEYGFSGKSGKKIYPNDPCPCGSGRKYKKCCGR